MFYVKNEVEKATVYIYGTIGKDYWDEDSSNTAKNFSKTLDELDGRPVDIRIDSCGGDVYEGFAIASAIQRYEGQTTAYIDGVAASAASYVAIMADKVVMTSFAQFMIHNAWTFASGNARELADVIKQLEGLDDTIARLLAARTGTELDAIKAAMAAETWYPAEQALESGFCDEVIEVKQRNAACLDRDLMRTFKNVPDELNEKSHLENNLPTEEKVLLLGNCVYTI
ncbi:MAG: Clp protease ClpP [Atopobium minutum]|uniref:ATP-dependent protease ClpP, protease subunit n=1 Tax=Atopobium minutum TaxID=1381 RepID=A0AB38A4V0_9ACTN|nr:head maturation protease, ClpP-related [Atopobium minutum]KRN55046.1 hypothetical protein IV72_GL000544 [Atopobium minutum]MBS4873948.1 Clp protease ClpP [Atopobium minutum]SEB43746.1 ATP-dependent protease ClpP, protease subunit [Atopobium minutum]